MSRNYEKIAIYQRLVLKFARYKATNKSAKSTPPMWALYFLKICGQSTLTFAFAVLQYSLIHSMGCESTKELANVTTLLSCYFTISSLLSWQPTWLVAPLPLFDSCLSVGKLFGHSLRRLFFMVTLNIPCFSLKRCTSSRDVKKGSKYTTDSLVLIVLLSINTTYAPRRQLSS